MSVPPQAPGRHLLIECSGLHAHLDAAALEALMKRAAAAGRAQVLASHMHAFGSGGGVTGVVLLAESHITVHTWPERDYAAFDVFMCGRCDAEAAAAVIEAAAASTVEIRSLERRTPTVTVSGPRECGA
ncbi:MAG: adenosylmethionine decarboxylase [Gammaproteobacteria bacterium]|nr:adenosylmethionine decarboxylase [Gammaproteobacteria bacterium]